MLKQLAFFVCTVIISTTLVVPTAQAIDMTTALKRMDEIIKQMEALRVEFSSLSASVGQTTPTPAVLGAQTGAASLTQSLEYGVTNDDIKRIQKLLATDPEVYPYGVSSGFFGPKTQEGIRNFQARFGLDTVGVVGPATKALFELFFAAYPDGNYPAGVLAKKPQVLGVSTSNPTTSTPAPTTPVGTNPAKSINVTLDDGEALIEIEYTNGNRKGLLADTEDKAAVVTFIASKTVLTVAQINAVISYETNKSSSSSSSDADEDEAEEALDDAEDAIDDAFDAIDAADEDGDDVDWAEDTLDEAEDLFDEAEDAFDEEDWDEAVDLANEAEDLANKAEDRIDKEEGDEKGDSDDIESIVAEVEDGETEVTVEYEDADEYVFTVEEDSDEDIIAEIADELDIDEDDVEDLIEFDYGEIDSITVRIDEDDSLVRIFYTSDVERRITVDETDEDDIIGAIAEELDEDEDDVEDWVDFE